MCFIIIADISLRTIHMGKERSDIYPNCTDRNVINRGLHLCVTGVG